MKSIIVAFCLTLTFVGCDILGEDETTNQYTTEAVVGDHSDISEPRARWEAYGLENYTIEQTRTCECALPYTFTVVVRSGEVVDVLYELPEDEKRWPVNDYETVLANAMTIDSLFALIESERPSAANIDVAYHAKYGYPTEVFIDRDERIADEEIIRSVADLKKLVE